MDWKNLTLRSVWKTCKDKLVLIFCVGLLLFILAIPTEKSDQAHDSLMITPAEETREEPENSSYEAALELRIREILEGVEGVGSVDVMVGTAMPEATGYVSWEQEVSPEVTGVVISADGGGSPTVQAEISQAMEALFGIPSHKIKVLKRVKKESEE